MTDDQERMLAQFTHDVSADCGAALRSLVIYGSSVGGGFLPGRSDYNTLLVAEPVDLTLLDRLGERMRRWREDRISVPLVMRPEFLTTALDSYPLEIIGMKARYRVLAGEDVLAEIVFSQAHVRLQCERELRSKVLLFRRGYLDAAGDSKQLFSLLQQGVPSLHAILRGLLFLAGSAWDSSPAEFDRACRDDLGISEELLAALRGAKSERRPPAGPVVRRVYALLLSEIEREMSETDRWVIPGS